MIEEQFANDVGKAIHVDPRVIFAQTQLEGAYAANGTGGLNFLNLKSATVQSVGGTEAGSTSGGFAQFADLQQAEQATIAEFKSPAIGPIYGITPRQQIEALAASPWDAGHYGGNGGQNLQTEFGRLFGTKALDQPVGLSSEGFGGDLAKLLASGGNPFTAITSSAIVGGSNPVSTGINDVTAGLGGIAGATFKGLTGFSFTQIIEMLGGGVLILLGIVIIVIGGKGTPQTQTARAVKTVAR